MVFAVTVSRHNTTAAAGAFQLNLTADPINVALRGQRHSLLKTPVPVEIPITVTPVNESKNKLSALTLFVEMTLSFTVTNIVHAKETLLCVHT